MRDFIPTHYVLLGAIPVLAVGIFIGAQFPSSQGPTTSSLTQPSTRLVEQSSAKNLSPVLTDNKPMRRTRGDTQALAADEPASEIEEHPARALAQALEQTRGLKLEQKLLALVDNWAAKDSKAAFLWLESHSNQIGANVPNLYSVIISHHIRQAPESSKLTISDMKPGALKNTLAAQLAEKLAETNPLDALQWSASLRGVEASSAAIEIAMQSYAEKDLEAAVEYALSVSDPAAQQKMLYDVGFVMASVDPTKVSNALDLFPTEIRSRLIPRIAWSLSQKDPEQTINWVEQLPQGNTRDDAIREASWGLVSANPEQAFRLASMVGDSATRYALVRDALMVWHRVDAVSTQQALESYSDFSESQKGFLLRDLQENATTPDLVAP